MNWFGKIITKWKLQPTEISHKNEAKSVNIRSPSKDRPFCCVAQERCCHGTAFLGVAHEPHSRGSSSPPRTPPCTCLRREHFRTLARTFGAECNVRVNKQGYAYPFSGRGKLGVVWSVIRERRNSDALWFILRKDGIRKVFAIVFWSFFSGTRSCWLRGDTCVVYGLELVEMSR